MLTVNVKIVRANSKMCLVTPLVARHNFVRGHFTATVFVAK